MSESLAYDPAASVPVRTRDITLRKDATVSWLARIYQPEKEGPLPVLIDVHGGAWSSGDHTTNAAIDQALAASGILVASARCRTAPDHPYPSQVQDVNFVTRWLKENADAFNGDATRMGGLGTSSGGHSLFLSAMRPRDSRYTALSLSGRHDAGLSYLIGAWPVLDPWARYGFARDTGKAFLTQKTEEYFLTEDAMAEGNPQLALERGEPLDLPPLLMIEGTADENLPEDAAGTFVRAYRTAGGEAQLELFPGMPHGFALKPGPEAARALELMKAFIAVQVA